MVYAIGGGDGLNHLKTAERYDCKTKQWSVIAPMKVRRSDASATVLNGKVAPELINNKVLCLSDRM
jgi:kelch-like protein 10